MKELDALVICKKSKICKKIIKGGCYHKQPHKYKYDCFSSPKYDCLVQCIPFVPDVTPAEKFKTHNSCDVCTPTHSDDCIYKGDNMCKWKEEPHAVEGVDKLGMELSTLEFDLIHSLAMGIDWQPYFDEAHERIELLIAQSRAEGVRDFADKLKEKMKPYGEYKCKDKEHDDRWCPTCEIRTDTIDMVEEFIDKLAGEGK